MKKNNKGFSLVELIVVVLIMGILAVALTPQVLKWIERSRIATDRALMDSLVSNAQTAMTKQTAYDVITKEGAKITITGSTVNAYQGDGTSTPSDNAFLDQLAKYSGFDAWSTSESGKTSMKTSVSTKISANQITIEISKAGKVTGRYQKGGTGDSIIVSDD